jgi:addiction module HigA family antidote
MTITRPSAGWNIQGKTTHPGAVLQEDFLKPLGITKNRLAMETRVPANRIGSIVQGTRAVTPETALRLARFFGNSPEFWLNLQQTYDLSSARVQAAEKVEKEVLPFSKEAKLHRKAALNPKSALTAELSAKGRSTPKPQRRKTA